MHIWSHLQVWEKRRKARGAPLVNDENLDDITPLTDSLAFGTLLQDESFSEDVREIMQIRMTSTCFFLNCQRSRKSFGAYNT